MTSATSPFDLEGLVIGPNSHGSGTIDATITADVFGGGPQLTLTFSGLTTATAETLDWTNLTAVYFSATSDAGIDNVSADVSGGSAAPEPSSVLLFAGGWVGIVALRLRRRT